MNYLAIAGLKNERKVGVPVKPTEIMVHRANEINEKVAAYFGLTPVKLASTCRHRKVATPRQISMYLIRQETDLSDRLIAEMFNRDRTTVIHSVEVVETELDPVVGENYFKTSIQQLKLII